MSDHVLPADSAPAARSTAPRDTLSRLTPLGWRGGLVALVLGLALSFFLFGYFAIYWRNADMDFMVVYNALVMNDGKPQEFFDHPGYLTILSVKYAFQALHAIGLLDAWTLPAIPSATDVPAFDAAMTQAVRAGRLVAWLTGTLAVLAFAFLMRRVVRDWRVALLAAFAFAFSGGVAVHLRILRSEMIAASMVVFALLVLIPQCRRGSIGRPLALAAVAFLCMLGLENKVHVIVLVAALPVLAVAFGEAGAASAAFWRQSPWAWPAVALAAVLAAVLVWSTRAIVAAGFDPQNLAVAELHPLLFKTYGVYQCALLLYAAVAVVVFALIRKVSVAETLAILFALAAGGALGLLVLDLAFNAQNAVAVLNPLEKMVSFSELSGEGASTMAAVLNMLEGGLIAVLKRDTFFLYTAARPTVFVLWLVLAGIVYAACTRKWQLALQATLLVLVATGVDCLGVPRGLKSEYFVLSDPFIIIAGALLLDRMPQLAQLRGALAIGIVLIVAHVVVAHPEPVKMVTKKSGPEYICLWNQIYQKLLPVPWCELPPKRL
ncbi:MAG: hypothetical protein ACLP8B_14595 [Xanthobacteraceae bacterium]